MNWWDTLGDWYCIYMNMVILGSYQMQSPEGSKNKERDKDRTWQLVTNIYLLEVYKVFSPSNHYKIGTCFTSFITLELRMKLALSIAQDGLNFLLLCDPESLQEKEKRKGNQRSLKCS